MGQDHLRNTIIENREMIKKLMLTDQQAEVLDYFSSYVSFRACDVSKEFGLNPSHSSMVMRGLYDKGYVSRTMASADTGGPEYIYMVRV